MSADKRPILVTGSHRSGSTWVGKMIAAAPAVGYVSEPFSPRHPPGICAAEFPRWFPYITGENENGYRTELADTVAFRYRYGKELRSLPRQWREARERRTSPWFTEDGEPRSNVAARNGATNGAPATPPLLAMPNPGRRMVRNAGEFMVHRVRGSRALIKDPMALFSAEWLAERQGTQNVVIIRHPAAFAASLQRVGWVHPFSHFLEQPLLMRDLLAPYEAEIRDYAQHDHHILDQASLLWVLIHHAVRTYQERHPDWIFVRHEDLSMEPVPRFRELFDQLGLEWSDDVEQTVRAHTQQENPEEPPEGAVEHIARDSRSNVKAWKRRLSDDEVARVRERAGDLAAAFYDDADW